MKSFGLAGIAAAGLIGSAVAQQLPSIERKGSKFFYSNNGTQFFIRGVAYQQNYQGNGTISANTHYTDPLSNADNCKRDIPYLLDLYTNTIRVYAIDPTVNHDDCMNQLQAAGIYVIADLSAPVYGQSIDSNDPSWDIDLYTRYTSVVDTMQKYSNVIGFFAGNEVSDQVNNTNAAPFVKAAVRDTKAYIKAKGYRTSLGVGYANDDGNAIRDSIADFFDCGDASTQVDFWGYNIYSWCGLSSYTQSHYDTRTDFFRDFNIPVFFAEYGCNSVEPRPFTEVQALYGPQMTPVWSGGIVYMYFQEENNFGLISLDGNSVSTLPGYGNLKTQLASVTPTGVNSASYTPTNTAGQACPTEDPAAWEAKSSPLPPSPNEQLCECMYQNLDCVVASSASSDSYADLFNEVFGYLANDGGIPGIAANGTTGTYGAYGMCNGMQKLGFAFDTYYKFEKSNKQACDFGGNATTQSGSVANGCSALLNQAGTSGTGSVTASPTGPNGAATTSGPSSSHTHKGAASTFAPSTAFQNLGMLPVLTISALAMVSGMGMIFL